MLLKNTGLLLLMGILMSCQAKPRKETRGEPILTDKKEEIREQIDYSTLDTATLAGGCFWCIEAAFEQIKGVEEAISGYAGGELKNPTYQQVSSGQTDHAETVQVFYDPETIDYGTILDIFFTAHDPTQLNRQGPDVGPQYRSAIFYHDQQQLEVAQMKIDSLNRNIYDDQVVTELNPRQKFYKAEEYHQDYEEKNPNNPYIVNVSRPKINKVKRQFKDRLKESQ